MARNTRPDDARALPPPRVGRPLALARPRPGDDGRRPRSPRASCASRSAAPRGCCCRSWSRSSAIVVVPELRWARWRYEVRDEEIDLRHGTVRITRTLVPMLRVQHVDTTQGPLDQALGLATVVVHTAAGTTTIPALDRGPRGPAARPDRRARPHRR